MNRFIPRASRYKYLLVAVCLLAIVSCQNDIGINDVEDDGKSLAILAVIRNGESIGVIVSTVQNFTNELVDYRVSDAEITVFEDDVPVYTITERTMDRYIASDIPVSPSVYVSTEKAQLSDNSFYRVEVRAPGYNVAKSSAVKFTKVIGEATAARTITKNTDGRLYFVDTINFNITENVQGEITLDAFVWNQDIDNTYINRFWLADPYQLSVSRPIYGVDIRAGSYTEVIPENSIFEDDYSPDETPFCGYITHRTRHYLEFAELYSTQDREEVANPRYNGQPLPDNFTDGFGYFTVIDSKFVCDE
ncbi:DUF4249 family protein [Neolewinella antarctica]|uniref:DUF4249 domain-containing protein n=1 Tax=Neolewinella antarctica TaxID=442734 RepID=A0ABX0XGC0_9BACT|nr:DUF4249 family protein [Neolewinella antarctica]NJC28360.1 hypothetical protein [Neolewinella antarctica]